MDIDTFKKSLEEDSPQQIYRNYLLGHDIWYFREYLGKEDHALIYDQLKCLISERLGVHPNNIAIVGSAKLGFSVTPTKDKCFSEFSADSDLDIAIVSPDVFRKSWDAFLDLYDRRRLYRRYQFITGDIFRRFVSLKETDSSNQFFRDWSAKVDPMMKDLQLIYSVKHDINYRIYESWEAVEHYHCQGLKKLQQIVQDDSDE